MTDRPPSSETDRAGDLTRVRAEIDAVDDRIHDLLIRRAELVQRVAATKGLADGSVSTGAYRPAREADIHRRLHARNRAPLPFETVFRLWREMIGAFTAIQAPVSVSVLVPTEPERRDALLRVAREHFGTAADLAARDSFDAVIRDLERAPGTIGVVATDSAEPGWWTGALERGAGGPRVIAAIPCYGSTLTGYCLGHAPAEPSGDDITLFAVRVPAERDIEAALAAPSSSLRLAARAGDAALVSVPGFHLAPDAARRQSLASALGIGQEDIADLGAFPVPIIEDRQ